MPAKSYQEIIQFKIAELKAGIANGTITAQPQWDLDETFDFFIEPFYQAVLTVNGTISVLLHLIVFWLIVYHSPKEMKDYKIFLLNIAIWSLIHDLQLTVYWKPVPIFPVTGAFVSGPSKGIGDLGGHYGMVSCIMLVSVYMCSMVSGFVYRLVSLLDTFWYRLMMSWLGLGAFVIVHAAPVALLGVMIALCHVDANFIRDKALKRFPQLEPILREEAIFGYDINENPMLLYFFIVVLLFIFVVVPLIGAGCILSIFYKLRQMKSVISAKTYRLHKTLLQALTVQILLPFFMILIPDVFLVFGAWKELKHVNFICEATLMLCTCHSVLDNCVMLFMITPYRKALIKIFKKSIFGKYKLNINLVTRVEASQIASSVSNVSISRATANSHRQ